MSLDVDSEKRRMYTKPPPPVPPRPPKPLIERALAKTRLQHDSSSPMPTMKPPSPPKPTILERRHLLSNNNSRPVVYQSANCKSAPPPPEKTPPKEINNNKEDLENSINSSSESLDKLKIDEDVESSKVLVESDSCDSFDCLFDNKNHVNTLIDEMFASVLEVSSTTPSPVTEIIINDNDSTTVTTYCSSIESMSNISESENLTVISINDDKSKFNDQKNHEFLISELQNMKVLKRQRLPSKSPTRDDGVPFPDKIQTNDWYGVNEGKKVKMSSCHIQIDDSALEYDKIDKMSKEYCLPPLPKSLTGHGRKLSRKESVSSQDVGHKEETNLEKKLAVLWREMVTVCRYQWSTYRVLQDSLREQDLSLLSKLWFLNESIQDFRQIIQEQEEVDKLHLMAPSPTPSSLEDEEFVIAASHC